MKSIIHPQTTLVQPDTKKIAVYLTNQCNLKCKHCFIEGSPTNNDFLSWNQVNTALHYFIKHNYKKVEFTGGESCLSPNLIPATKLAKKLGYNVGVCTNGINQNLFKLINNKYVDKITVSLDGSSSKTHDFLRGENVFKKTIETLKNSIKKGFHTEAIYTVHKLNFHEIGKVIPLLDKIGVKRLSFNFISNQGTAILNQDLLLPPEKWVEARHIIDSFSKTKQMIIRYPMLFVTQNEFAEIKKNTDCFCRLIKPTKTDIYPDGNIYHCCLVTDFDNLSAGKVTNTKVIMNSAKERKFVIKYSHLSCPIHAIKKLYANNSKLIPLCIYYKSVTKS